VSEPWHPSLLFSAQLLAEISFRFKGSKVNGSLMTPLQAIRWPLVRDSHAGFQREASLGTRIGGPLLATETYLNWHNSRVGIEVRTLNNFRLL
jgi:hypothetical protein